MEKVRFWLPNFSIDAFEILNVFENNGYREDYDIFNDWIEKFARDFVDCYNKKRVPFKIKYVLVREIVEGSYFILISCDKNELYDFLDEHLVDTKENYNIDEIISDLESGSIYNSKLSDVFNNAWANYARNTGMIDINMNDFMEKNYQDAINLFVK